MDRPTPRDSTDPDPAPEHRRAGGHYPCRRRMTATYRPTTRIKVAAPDRNILIVSEPLRAGGRGHYHCVSADEADALAAELTLAAAAARAAAPKEGARP